MPLAWLGWQLSATLLKDVKPSYEGLFRENQELKKQLRDAVLALPTPRLNEVLNITERFEEDLFDVGNEPGRVSTVTDDKAIIWPSAQCVQSFLSYGKTWTSWIHCAFHHPTFERECAIFLGGGTNSANADDRHPFWLAVFFSFMCATLIFMDEDELIASGASADLSLLHNWYDSALYFLHQGDYLRNHDMRTVQAVAILGIVFTNMGDSKLQSLIWSSAIRIAQSLRMDDDRANLHESAIATQVRRRLWWTLVICEWLPVPYRAPCITAADFNVDIPTIVNDDELDAVAVELNNSPRPVEYHLQMIKISRLIHSFRSSLRQTDGQTRQISNLVLRTDEALAEIIESLPSHLQMHQVPTDEALADEKHSPWIAWQRLNLSLSLLYYRIVINRVLQDQWFQDPETFARTRAICLSSAQGIISLSAQFDPSLARHRPWYLYPTRDQASRPITFT
ncbi:hypothetical protein EG328_003329 [Venturia inaequalis]|uniref:Xylanolytic transcriptional activator regulatory domain-containing protein n=1 Tax=Venturia inaequalis TaxID=5025 RepID=A0A8H3VFC4_VENIN|nr:hypothetical protein EG328_003329 [Venturia inaequalis]